MDSPALSSPMQFTLTTKKTVKPAKAAASTKKPAASKRAPAKRKSTGGRKTTKRTSQTPAKSPALPDFPSEEDPIPTSDGVNEPMHVPEMIPTPKAATPKARAERASSTKQSRSSAKKASSNASTAPVGKRSGWVPKKEIPKDAEGFQDADAFFRDSDEEESDDGYESPEFEPSKPSTPASRRASSVNTSARKQQSQQKPAKRTSRGSSAKKPAKSAKATSATKDGGNSSAASSAKRRRTGTTGASPLVSPIKMARMDQMDTSELDDSSLRRSGRTRTEPTRYWMNERPVYDRTSNTMIGVLRVEDLESPSKSPSGGRVKGRMSAADAEIQGEIADKFSETSENDAAISVVPADGDEDSTCKVQVVKTLDMMKMSVKPIRAEVVARRGRKPDAPIDEDFLKAYVGINGHPDGYPFKTGLLEIPPLCRKKEAYNEQHIEIYHVQSGTVAVALNDSQFLAPEGSFFFIPHRNSYSLENTSSKQRILLSFCIVPALQST